ncbi:S41 family peptidase [Pseudogracilibacillus sp. SO30301A]|uniref:S41 family peptidase n=1 Tax=Pseudogracilibacillus sp. SO30301A TaxID=3098291 RepID=UPI00300DE8F1
MTFKKRELIIFILVTFAVGFLGAFAGLKLLQPKVSQQVEIPFVKEGNSSELDEDMQTIKQAYELIEQHYVEGVEENQLLEGAIQGMLETLDDPYSSFMNTEAMERFNEQIQSSFQGIGAEVSMVEGKVTIVAPIKDSPAEKAGLRPNDQILKVDDEELEGLNLNEAVEKIRGEKGSEVVLLVQRKGSSKPFEVEIVREDIPIETVHKELETVDGKKTGIIEISSFSETTANEFEEILLSLEEDGIEGLVIDVRGNPGGLLDSIEEILHSFVPDDIPYLQIEDGEGKKDKFYTNLKEKKPYPISVVIDEGSASASEILAAAMKEIGYDIVGTTSFGKGTVQQAVPIGNKKEESTIKLTFYKWLSPKGNWINEVGVEPTIEQKQPEFFYANPIQVEKTLKLDNTDEQIKNAQIMLSGIGYDTKRDDGYFDKKTKQAVMEFQKDHDLTVNGEINEETAYAIESKVIEIIRSKEQDLQLQKALEELYK